MLTEELNRVKRANEHMTKTLEESQNHKKVHQVFHCILLHISKMGRHVTSHAVVDRPYP